MTNIKYVIICVEVEMCLYRTESVFSIFDKKSNIVCQNMQLKHVVVEGVDGVEID